MRITRSGHSSPKSLKIKWLLIVLGFALVLAGIVLGVRLFDTDAETRTFGSLEGRFEEAPTIAYQGRTYAKNTKLKTYLFMGVDNYGDEEMQSNSFRNGGQCDFLMLIVIDSEHKTVRRIQIDRDTMAEITVLGILGNDLGTSTMQICLAHGFGDGKEQSCRFAVEAVERFLYGIDVDGYFAMDLDGIVTLNELLGGVTVTIEDDFSVADPAMTPGTTLKLQGDQAETYVRRRLDIGDGTNEARMQRQKQFLNNAMDMVIARMQKDTGFFGALFDGLKPYTVTDISRGKMINEANKAGKYASDAILTPAGRHTVGMDGFVEFHADSDALVQLVLEVFYDPKL